MVLSESCRTALMLASKLAWAVLQTCEEAGTRTTQSLCTRIWQVST